MATKTAGLAYLFPGQGSQYVGMGRDLVENFPVAREVFEKVDDALGFKLSELCFNGPEDELQLTENTQPALLAASVAAYLVLEAEGFPMPDYVAGHSLGEYSAVVAAGGLALEDAVRLVRKRGLYMQEAVPVGEGAMAAILGADVETVADACLEAAQGEVCSLANINSPKQSVIAGHETAVARTMELVKARGAKRVIKLRVSAPFHCALMQPAQDRLSADLEQLEFKELRVPLVRNVDAAAIRDGSGVRQSLVRQVTSPVQWLDSVKFLASAGVETFIEVGPGKVLAGLVRHTIADVRALNVGDLATLEAARVALSESQAASGGN